MTFKRRLWNTISLTILISLVVLNTSIALTIFDSMFFDSHSKDEIILSISLTILFPFILFIFQSFFKKEYPDQEKTTKHPKLKALSWILLLLLPVSIICRSELLGLLGLLLLPVFWVWIIIKLKNNYGKKAVIISFFLLLIFALFLCNTSFTFCPSDRPLKHYYECGHSGGCRSCDERASLNLKDPEDCTKLCPNRYSDGYQCHYVVESCPANAPLKKIGIGWLGENSALIYQYKEEQDCYSCDDPRGLMVANCDVCPDRQELKTTYGKVCALKTCPEQQPLRDVNYGDCHSCDEKNSFKVENAEDCTKLCPERQLSAYGWCDLKEDREEKNEIYENAWFRK